VRWTKAVEAVEGLKGIAGSGHLSATPWIPLLHYSWMNPAAIFKVYSDPPKRRVEIFAKDA
jgi:hypothetical protein